LSLAAFGFISYGQLRYNFIGASKQSQSMEEDKRDNCKYLIAPINNCPRASLCRGTKKLKSLGGQNFSLLAGEK